MFYIMDPETKEVFGAALSTKPDEDWLTRYAEALEVKQVEAFEAKEDPRPKDARTEKPEPVGEYVPTIKELDERLKKLESAFVGAVVK